MIGLLCVLGGAAIGAPARYLVDRSIQARHETLMPWGTMSTNLIGSAILGLLAGIEANHHITPSLVLLIGTGFCGTLTTFSTHSYESLRLYQTGARTEAVLNIVISLTAGLGAVSISYALGVSF